MQLCHNVLRSEGWSAGVTEEAPEAEKGNLMNQKEEITNTAEVEAEVLLEFSDKQ